MGKRDTKAAKAKRAERRGKGALKTGEKTAKSEEKQQRRDANQQDNEDLEKVPAPPCVTPHSQAAARHPSAPLSPSTPLIRPHRSPLLVAGAQGVGRHAGQRGRGG